jgi:hypothetical protein
LLGLQAMDDGAETLQVDELNIGLVKSNCCIFQRLQLEGHAVIIQTFVLIVQHHSANLRESL